jgi:autotransporter-associated beta strand protein
MIINGRISGPGKLYVHESLANATTLTLANGANNWTGGTEVESGELHLTATGALGSGLVTVDTGAILSGSGTIAGPVTVASDSLLQPGQGGTDSSALTINNTLSLSGTTLIAINRTNASNASTLTGISTLTRGGTLTVINVGPDPQVGDSFALFRASSFTGTFSTTDLPSLVGILFWTLNNGTLSVSATPSAPIVITEPVGGTRYVGGTFTFTPLLQGYPVPHWQWKHNASNITGATNLTLTLTNLQASDAGNYILYATNSLGFTNTATATLSVLTASGYAAAVLANNPMGYWRFSEGGGTYALDYISGNDAVDPLGSPLQAGPQPTAFPGFESTNTAPFMDGMSQGYATTVPLFNNLSNFTIMGWFNIDPNQYPFVPDPFYHPDGRASLFGLEWAAELGFYQGNQLYFFGTGIDHTIFVTNGFAAGQWNFVAAVSDAVAHTTTLYLNGVAAGTASACPGTVQPWVFSIGKNVAYYPESGYDNAFFPGSLDEVAAFSHALPASAIQALYQAALRFKINIVPQAGGLQVSWPVGHLESASSPTGHWATVTGAVSPLSVTPTDARKFYRAVSP